MHTSLHFQRAIDGDRASLDWVAQRFTPFLEAQIRMRLGSRATAHDVADLVSDAWLIAIRKFSDLEPRNGRIAPVLAKFLGTTALYLCNNHLRGRIHNRSARSAGPVDETSEHGRLDDFARDSLGVVTRAVQRETVQSIRECLAAMPEDRRQILALRLLEQQTNHEIAESLGLVANTVAARYRRALQELRARLPRDDFIGIFEARM